MTIALRIDVDTLRGTRDGVPVLAQILRRHGIRASWYFSVGPDNMGRHLRRLIRPSFAVKMLKSKAASLYGWDIVFKGTFWPGPLIGERAQESIRRAMSDDQELGLHAWDHHRWQVGVDRLGPEGLRNEIQKAWDVLVKITGREPVTSASPGWRCTEEVLKVKEEFPFVFNSDCRGPAEPFIPKLGSEIGTQPQVPVDLPTYDESVGRDGMDDAGWNSFLLSKINDGKPHVLTIHAESEGGVKARLFEDFLENALSHGHRFTTLGNWLGDHSELAPDRIHRGEILGREGWLATASTRSEPSELNT